MGAHRASQERGPLIQRDASVCAGCWSCVRHCPARALKAVDGHAEVIPERCVACGVCVTECRTGGQRIRDDLPVVRELLESGRPVVALLASEHIAAMHPLAPGETEHALEFAGFAGIETTVLGEELVAAAYERLHASTDRTLPSLRSTCPVASDWVRRFHPLLSSALAPVVPPYIAQARLIRSLYPADAAIVYVSPCWARKDEIYEPAFEGAIDVAIGFDELKRLIEGARGSGSAHMSRPQPVKQTAAIDGFPRKALSERDLTSRDVVVVRGLEQIDRLLTAMSRGEVWPELVDMLNCEGCIDGPCVSPELSVYVKRSIDAKARETQPAPAVDTRTLLSTLPAVDLRRRFEPKPALTRDPSDAEIDAVLAAGEFMSRSETVDCGACGYSTCVDHAAAICLELSTWDVCFPLARKRLERERDHLAHEATVDKLTGLLNRRAFDRRLADEFSRARRYGTHLSLVMFDLDGFKRINDESGHQAGDALLRAVGGLLRSSLRTSDLAARFGGDEFAVLLPGTGKTEAWAVSEKLRGGIRSIDAQPGRALSATASMGVATLSEEMAQGSELVEAADAALLVAKRLGRDRVELAPG